MVRGKIVSMKQEFVPMTRFGSFLLIILGEKRIIIIRQDL